MLWWQQALGSWREAWRHWVEKGNWEVEQHASCMLSFPKFCERPTCLGKGENTVTSKLVPERLTEIWSLSHRTELGASCVLWVELGCASSSSGFVCTGKPEPGLYAKPPHLASFTTSTKIIHCAPAVSLIASFLPLHILKIIVTDWPCLLVLFKSPWNLSDAEMSVSPTHVTAGNLAISASMCPQTGEISLESSPWLCMANCNCYHLGFLLQSNILKLLFFILEGM